METKMVSINAIEEVMKDRFSNGETIQWYGVEIEIKKTIDLRAMMEFVAQSVNNCFSDSDGSYIPEMKDFTIRACMIEKYTNVRLPENPVKLYKMMYETDLCDLVITRINRQQLDAIIDAINEKLEYEVNSAIKTIQKTYDDVVSLSESISEIFSNITNDDITALTKAIGNGKIDEGKLMEAYAEIMKSKSDPSPTESELHVVGNVEKDGEQ